MGKRLLPVLILLFTLPAVCLAGPIEKVAELIKQGNAHELAKYFAANVDITLLDNSNVYAKAQAETILDKFFRENRPLSVHILHKVDSSSTFNMGVIILNTDKGKFRVAFTIKELEKQMSVIELRIETEKT